MDLELICPGLFGPIDLSADGQIATTAIDRLLSRADGGATQPRDPLEILAARFGLAAASGSDLPSAPLCLLSDAPELDPSGFWLHADPVHLYADRDRLILFAGPSLDLQADESAALAATFNDHFESDGLRLIVTDPGRWYLYSIRTPDLITRPLHAVAGGPVDGALPTGTDARDWIRWQNEAQMLFYTHPVNQARERRGAPTIGAIWTWGGGRLPSVGMGPDLMIADHPFAVGLCKAAGTRLLAPGSWQGDLDTNGSTVIFWDEHWWPALNGDTQGWLAGLAELESMVAGLLDALMKGGVSGLTLDDGQSRRFEASRGGMLRFWRQRGRLMDWCRTE